MPNGIFLFFFTFFLAILWKIISIFAHPKYTFKIYFISFRKMKRHSVLLLLGLFCAFSAIAQEHIEKRYTLFFRVGKSNIDTTYMGNGRTIKTMVDDIRTTLQIDGAVPDSLLIYASTSPEGPVALNNRLANERTKNSKDLLVSLFPQFKPENIRVESRANDWSGMILILRRDNSIRNRDIILKILTDPSITNKDAAVRRHPQAYAEIRDGLFDNMRTASISISVVKTATNLDEFVAEPELFITSQSPMQFAAEGGNGTITYNKSILDDVVPTVTTNAEWIGEIIPSASEIKFKVAPNAVTEPRTATIKVECYGKSYDVVVNQLAAEPAPVVEPVVEEEEELPPFYMAIKNNMLYDLAAVPNLGIEFYLGKNWSIVGNWMYAWWKTDKKSWYWRTYGGDLAVRKWFGKAADSKPLTGHHLGLYGQIVTYDFETGGRGYLADRWSYGGGIEYGYSLPIARRLNIDFNIGVGYLGGEVKEYLPIDGHYVWQLTKQSHWFGPTKLEVALTWLIGRGNYNKEKGGKR